MRSSSPPVPLDPQAVGAYLPFVSAGGATATLFVALREFAIRVVLPIDVAVDYAIAVTVSFWMKSYSLSSEARPIPEPLAWVRRKVPSDISPLTDPVALHL